MSEFRTRLISALALSMIFAIPSYSTAAGMLNNVPLKFLYKVRSDGEYSIIPGKWTVFDVAGCMADPRAPYCWGTNPDSPYSFPEVVTEQVPQTSESWRIREDAGVVLILQTPPKMRYFGFTPYLKTRTYNGTPEMLFASINDPLNNLKISTAGEGPDAAYNNLAVIVLTADVKMYNDMKRTFARIGVPLAAMNVTPLPLTLPLFMGVDNESDSFGMLLRVAIPELQQALDWYLSSPPITVFTLTPTTPRSAIPFPYDGLTPPGSGISEPAGLETKLDDLVSRIAAQYQDEYVLTENEVLFGKPYGPECILNEKRCNADNNDGTYYNSLRRQTFPDDLDFVLVAGVNHQRTNKAQYINHTIMDPRKFVGVVASDDSEFDGSAAYHAGILPGDPEYAEFADLYATMFAYDCRGRQYCTVIPTTDTTTEPIAVDKEVGFMLTDRVYLDPVTRVRPLETEMILHRVFLGNITTAPPLE